MAYNGKGSKPWLGKQQQTSVTGVFKGMRSPLNQGHHPPLPKGGDKAAPQKK
jgi:hypothetical protein